MTDTSVRHASADAGVRRVRAYARRANSEDSIEVLSTTESIFPDDLTAITEEEAEQQILSNGSQDEEEAMAKRICGGVHEVEGPSREVEPLKAGTVGDEDKHQVPVKEEESPVDGGESLKEETVNTLVMIREETPRESLKTNQIYEDDDPGNAFTPAQGKKHQCLIHSWLFAPSHYA